MSFFSFTNIAVIFFCESLPSGFPPCLTLTFSATLALPAGLR